MHSERRNLSSPSPRIDADDAGIVLLSDPVLPCHVLVVDDDELVIKRMGKLLESRGYVVHTALSGEEALRVLDTTVCQIVLTDWRMPDMDGLALCRNLRERQSDGYIYILMLTIRNKTSDILAGLAAGADDYLIKGANSAEILARVEVGRRTTHLDRSLRASNRENRRMSVTDALTGVHNRRFLMEYLPRELERSRRYNHPLAIVSCDIDHFKKINDGFGHEAGDEILQAFTARAQECIRQGIDWISRSGGEEFVIVLPETDLNGASCVAKRLRHALAARPISTSSGPVAVTVSMGVTAVETAHQLSAMSVAQLLRAADCHLYTSKHLGRNRVTASLVGCGNLLPDAIPSSLRDTH
ncbi:MAG TPA: diguanylate cyclase [Steroidobacteraceae bacterium]|jgi:diguanylate cyclase (GGDEF)-like protein|nr:diguanylate cyclase [Steroidobacteraceae bacterium]